MDLRIEDIPVYVIDRFWRKVDKKSNHSNECWLWTASRTLAGYGQLQARKVSEYPLLAHRVSWVLARGFLSGDDHVLHSCDNPPCVCPQHLFLGDQAVNNEDRDSKGRTASGEKNGARTKPSCNPFVRDGGSCLIGEYHPMAKLSDQEVEELRSMFETGINRGVIAAKFDISVTHVYRIGNGSLRRRK
jgi:hypothetical protein